jgi:hypothetical protein
MSYKASTVLSMTQDLDPDTARMVRLFGDSGARSQDEGLLGTPKMIRWRAEQLARAGAVAQRIGLSRSAVIRMAFDRGIEAVEQFAASEAAGTVPADTA